jgi:hypothetical protein
MRFNDSMNEEPFLIPKDWTGRYEFRIYRQYGYGKNSLYSISDTIK